MGHRRRFTAALAVAGAAMLVGAPGGVTVRRLQRSWASRVAVEGGSMAPELLAGDWLLVDPDGFDLRAPAPGDLVVVPDPRSTERWLVKRVRSVDAGGQLDVRGDAPDTSTDSRTFGPVERAAVMGRPWWRYWPPQRFGSVR